MLTVKMVKEMRTAFKDLKSALNYGVNSTPYKKALSDYNAKRETVLKEVQAIPICIETELGLFTASKLLDIKHMETEPYGESGHLAKKPIVSGWPKSKMKPITENGEDKAKKVRGRLCTFNDVVFNIGINYDLLESLYLLINDSFRYIDSYGIVQNYINIDVCFLNSKRSAITRSKYTGYNPPPVEVASSMSDAEKELFIHRISTSELESMTTFCLAVSDCDICPGKDLCDALNAMGKRPEDILDERCF